MKTIGKDADGHPIPGVPDPGDPICILWAAREDAKQQWADAHLVRIDHAGLWWVPADDRSGAFWSPWKHIIEIEGPLP